MRCQLRQCFGYRAMVVRRIQQGKIKLFLRGGQKVERIIRENAVKTSPEKPEELKHNYRLRTGGKADRKRKEERLWSF